MSEEGLVALSVTADRNCDNKVDYEEFMAHFKSTIKVLKTQLVLNALSLPSTTCCTPRSDTGTSILQ